MLEIKDPNTEKTLHIIHRFVSTQHGRQELVQPNNFLQCAALGLNAGKTFKPHKHIWRQGEENTIAQESWVVISGCVVVTYYDLSNNVISSHTLNPGDVSITLEGGHNYTVMADNTIVYEFKTGPYRGQSNDKLFI